MRYRLVALLLHRIDGQICLRKQQGAKHGRQIDQTRRTVMKMLMSLGFAVTFLLFGNTEASAAGCDAAGNVRFICDQLGPEDLVAVPGSEWVLSSGTAVNGAIRLINIRDKTTTVLFPAATSRERLNKKTYDSCPG